MQFTIKLAASLILSAALFIASIASRSTRRCFSSLKSSGLTVDFRLILLHPGVEERGFLYLSSPSMGLSTVSLYKIT